MNSVKLLVAVGVVLGFGTAFADHHEYPEPKMTFSASDTTSLTATVTAIDYETREVSLRGPEGNTVSFVVTDAVQRLDEINVGDLVTLDVDETLTVDVYDNDSEEPDTAEMAVLARNTEDNVPGGAVIDATVVTAVVQAIDLANNTATLRGPDGSLRTIVARNPENLKRASVGDLVAITITDAVGISVTPPPAE
ncbi:MAG TPA: hypothetical protein PKK10_07995 [Woeseiaceae bacterium]|nr:hypothetical protein [Woeseiaceae bacterium]